MDSGNKSQRPRKGPWNQGEIEEKKVPGGRRGRCAHSREPAAGYLSAL